MGCILGLMFLGMAGGGGYFWAASGQFLWAGVVCVVGILGLLYMIISATKGGAVGAMFDGFGEIGFGD